MAKKYEVIIENADGVCLNELFKKMAQKGDISACKVEDVLGRKLKIMGYACCRIVTDEKEFNLIYYATDIGYFSSGSEFLWNSYTDYSEDTDTFVIQKIKTKKGFTYKMIPIIEE